MEYHGSIASCLSLSTGWWKFRSQAAHSSSPLRRLWRNTTAVQVAPTAGAPGAVLGFRGGEAAVGFPTEAGSLGSPTTSMPAISIARRPAILHRWGYGWIFL